MIRGYRVASLLLVLGVGFAATPASAARVAPSVVHEAGSYWVAITLPNHQSVAAMLVLDDRGGQLHGMLVVEGSPAVELDKVTRRGDDISAEVGTSSGPARLLAHLGEQGGRGTLELIGAR